MKIFVSMAMDGKPIPEIKEQVKALADKFEASIGEDFSLLKDNTVEVIDSVVDLGDKSGLFYLGHGLKLMADADAVVMAKGWDKARGCKLEEACAKAYNLKVIYETDTGFHE